MIIQGKFSLYFIELNRFVETVQMRGHNICLCAELTKIIPNYHQCFLMSRFLSIKGRVLKGIWSFFVKIGTLCGLKLQNCIVVSLHCRNRQYLTFLHTSLDCIHVLSSLLYSTVNFPCHKH